MCSSAAGTTAQVIKCSSLNQATVEKAWVYCVVSSDAQEESLPAQKRWGFEEAARIGVHVDRVFPDEKDQHAGVASGKVSARKLLLKLLDELERTPKAQRPSRVLMVRLDRVGRMPMDAISEINRLRKLGVIIRTRKDGDLTFSRMIDMVGPMFELMQAGFENEVRSDRGKAAHQRRRDEGKLVGAKPAYGIKRDERGFAIADPACALVIVELFEKWVAGASPQELVVWLRSTAPPRIGRGGREIHIDWSLSHVYKAIKVRTYRGVVVPEDLWDRAQKRGKPQSRPGNGGWVYPFTGMRCHCGERLRPRTVTSPTRHVRKDGTEVLYPRKTLNVWYVCQSMRHQDGPKFRSYREKLVEKQWLKLLAKLAGENGFAVKERVLNLVPRIEMLQRRLDALVARRNRIHAAFEDGAYDAKTMQSRLAVVEEEERKLEAEIVVAQAEREAQKQRHLERDRVAEVLRNAAKYYPTASRETKAELNRAIFAACGAPVINDSYRLRLPDVKIPRR